MARRILSFIAAVYNEQDELPTLVAHVAPFVDGFYIVDDESTDSTAEWLDMTFLHGPDNFWYKTIPHTGLPETVKNAALQMVPDKSWVLMLDADERLHPDTIKDVRAFVDSEESSQWDYVYFQQLEVIDGSHVRTFQKCKLFRKEAITFPLNNIHADDQFTGNGTYKPEWLVFHRKSSNKQVLREKEYLQTYKKLLDEGKIDHGRYEWLKGLHHYVRE